MKDEEWQSLLDQLEERVLSALREETTAHSADITRLARDYESYCRMGHAPARAVRLAEQLLFQQKRYGDRNLVHALAMEITAMLARLYRARQTEGDGNQSGQ